MDMEKQEANEWVHKYYILFIIIKIDLDRYYYVILYRLIGAHYNIRYDKTYLKKNK